MDNEKYLELERKIMRSEYEINNIKSQIENIETRQEKIENTTMKTHTIIVEIKEKLQTHIGAGSERKYIIGIIVAVLINIGMNLIINTLGK